MVPHEPLPRGHARARSPDIHLGRESVRDSVLLSRFRRFLRPRTAVLDRVVSELRAKSEDPGAEGDEQELVLPWPQVPPEQ